MNIKLIKADKIDQSGNIVFITSKETVIDPSFFSKAEYNYIKEKIAKDDTFISINQYNRFICIAILDMAKKESNILEDARKAGYKTQNILSDTSLKTISVYNPENHAESLIAFSEGFVLGTYSFSKYLKNKEDKKSLLEELKLVCKSLPVERVNHVSNIIEALFKVRDLVNEPASYLNAVKLANEFKKMGKEAGFSVEILNKSKIESLKMGGLLAVNQGSVDPPTFTVMEWKPSNAINSKPYVLIGKGIVYDTGGLSLKPTSDSMDYMKSDMAGAATATGIIYTIAKNKLPVYLVVLAPATDNRISATAYAPGDIITMMDGTTVEMVNSDAEGRMILADALCYAKKYEPELVIDIATLTGSAARAIGSYGLVAMGNASDNIKKMLKDSGDRTYERIVEFPIWEDYAEMLKSDIADIKNVGGKQAGAITAGKFLEHFTAFPWIHLDIAGVAFSKKNDNYRKKGGTGFGMRLLCDFFYNICKKR